MNGRRKQQPIRWATYGRFETSDEMNTIVQNQRDRFELIKLKPKLSLVCIYRRDRGIERTVTSLVAQSYPLWELLIVSDGRVDLPFQDDRIRFIQKPFATMADAKNIALSATQGEWFGVIDTGDVLNPVALFQFASHINQNPRCTLFYSNEAGYDAETNEVKGFWSKGKPSWFNLVHFNSIGRGFLVKTSLLQEREAFNPKYSPDEEQGLFLRLSLENFDWKFIPEYLYYRSEDPLTSVLRRREIVEEHLKSKGLHAYVGCAQKQLDVQPVLKEPKTHLISVIVPCKDRVEMTLRCLDELSKQAGEVPVEVLLVNNASSPAALEKLRREISRYTFFVKIIDYPKPFNFAGMNNTAIRDHSKGDLLLLLNNDVFLEGSRSLDLMAAWALLESTGTVGIRLHYEHGKIQHSGFDARFGGFSRMVRVGNAQGRDRFARENHEVFGSTFACCLFKRTTYDSLGGFREIDLANGFGDIAFNFECLKRGLHNLYLGQIRGLHLESASRGQTYEYWEECILEREYPEILQKMLREDLAVDRLPASDDVILGFLKESAMGKLRKHAPWLKGAKRNIERRLFQMNAEDS